MIVGDDHTFGKGTVQSVFPLPPGLGALKVTTALFFRPGGASTQASGVASDVVVPSPFNLDLFGEQQASRTRSRRSRCRPSRARRPTRPTAPELDARHARSSSTRSAQRSEERQQGDDALQKVREELAERANDDGVLEIAEILKPNGAPTPRARGPSSTPASPPAPVRARPRRPTTAGAKTKPDPHEPTPQLEEALRVLGDLVVLQPGEGGAPS